MLILDLFRLELFTECRRRGLNFGTTFKSSHLLPLNLVSVLSQDDNTLIHGFGSLVEVNQAIVAWLLLTYLAYAYGTDNLLGCFRSP